MATSSDKVLLTATDTGKSKQFDADHAERILNIPGTKWQRATEEAPAQRALAAAEAPAEAPVDANAGAPAEAAPAASKTKRS